MAEPIERVLGRIEGKLDGFLDRIVHQENHSADLETRTRSLEAWRWKAAGVFAAVLVLAGWVVK